MTRTYPTVDILQVDVFTSVPFAGNPAGVVLDADGLSDGQMRAIAAEMNVGATAFLGPPSRAAADGPSWALRWFTPSGVELALCGHGTVAAVHALVESGRSVGSRLFFETRRRLLPASVEETAAGRVVWIEPDLPGCAPEREPLAPVIEALGLPPERVAIWAPPSRTSEGDLLIPVTGLDVLKGLTPDLGRLGRLGGERGIRGFCLTARETVEPGSLSHSRFFAPHLGIPEDFTTGSVHAALPVWLWEAGVLPVTGAVTACRAEQGDFCGRPGRLALELHLAGGRPARVRVGGQAVTVVDATMRLA